MNDDKDFMPHYLAAYFWYETWIPRIDGYTCVVRGREYAAPPGQYVPNEALHGIHGLPFVFSYATVLFRMSVN